MCGRYVIFSDLVKIEKQFNIPLKAQTKISPSFNASPSQLLPVISDEDVGLIQNYRFGYTPNWSSDGRMTINARVDVSTDNPENQMDYFEKGGKPGIYNAKYWRQSIRSKRCIVIADAFYEGPEKEKLSKPYLVHMRNKNRPFAMAGVWDEFETADGVKQKGFAILTVPANALLKKLGHHRSPVIIPNDAIKKYLQGELQEISSMLVPFDASKMNAYPVDPQMKNARLNNKDLLEPTGQRVVKEFEEVLVPNIRLEGMGESRKDRLK